MRQDFYIFRIPFNFSPGDLREKHCVHLYLMGRRRGDTETEARGREWGVMGISEGGI